MNKIILTALIALAGTSSAFAERAQAFGPVQIAKEAPVVSKQMISSEAKSTGRTGAHDQGVKQAGPSVDLDSIASFSTSDWTVRSNS